MITNWCNPTSNTQGSDVLETKNSEIQETLRFIERLF